MRAAHRVKEAFGNLAKDAQESIEVSIDVENNTGEVIIRIKYAGIEVAGSDSLVAEKLSRSEDGPDGELDLSALSESIEADNPVDDQMIYTGPEMPADLQIDPNDIEMIEDGEVPNGNEVDGGLAAELLMENEDLNKADAIAEKDGPYSQYPETHIDTV